jgi:AbiV family abortive infection protein
MPISNEKGSLEEIRHFNNTIANAKRLAHDSRILIAADRPQTSIVLAILAIEELGKALIIAWGVRNLYSKRTHPTHVEKQSATFALLAGVEATQMTQQELLKINEAGGGFHEMGPLSSQFAFARSGFFDDVRMAATYADQDPKLPLDKLQLSIPLAIELLDWFELAGNSVATNAPAMELAAIIYENNLGRA